MHVFFKNKVAIFNKHLLCIIISTADSILSNDIQYNTIYMMTTTKGFIVLTVRQGPATLDTSVKKISILC